MTSITYDLGGYDPTKPYDNVISYVEDNKLYTYVKDANGYAIDQTIEELPPEVATPAAPVVPQQTVTEALSQLTLATLIDGSGLPGLGDINAVYNGQQLATLRDTFLTGFASLFANQQALQAQINSLTNQQPTGDQ